MKPRLDQDCLIMNISNPFMTLGPRSRTAELIWSHLPTLVDPVCNVKAPCLALLNHSDPVDAFESEPIP